MYYLKRWRAKIKLWATRKKYPNKRKIMLKKDHKKTHPLPGSAQRVLNDSIVSHSRNTIFSLNFPGKFHISFVDLKLSEPPVAILLQTSSLQTRIEMPYFPRLRH